MKPTIDSSQQSFAVYFFIYTQIYYKLMQAKAIARKKTKKKKKKKRLLFLVFSPLAIYLAVSSCASVVLFFLLYREFVFSSFAICIAFFLEHR